jgi:hypothetical protein
MCYSTALLYFLLVSWLKLMENVNNVDKRYQVFVSSTYEDLIEERLEVMKALLELDCIPCGMEYFPAANEDQWTFIKKLIDTCDYYVVIISGRYGSEDSEGNSYTQKEYQYALSKEIPTIGFIHHDRNSISPEKRETEEKQIEKLEEFVSLVRSKLCKDWNNAYELGAVVSRSLTQLMKSNPRTGWVRADKVSSEELLEEINGLRKENEVLKEQIAKFEGDSTIDVDINNIAFEENTKIHGTYKSSNTIHEWSHNLSWKDLFLLISPYLLQSCNEQIVKVQIAETVLKTMGRWGFYSEQVDGDFLQSIKVQFLALSLIQVNVSQTVGGSTGLFWELTQKGKQIMLNERSIKK